MKDFLEYVADDMLSKYGTNLSHIAVVFPNKRASLFLNEHLARIARKPIWSPASITISELFRQQSQRQVADPVKLVCDLHKSFCLCTGSQETLDKFYGWGQLLLTDFDDIDKNMADADRVFANLRDIHELDDISYLTDEQRQMLHRFFSNFSEDHNSELKERFLRLWSHFADIYHDFNRRLASQNLAYEGALYRQVVETLKLQTSNIKHQTSNIKHQTSNFKLQTSNFKLQTSNITSHLFLFVGFNLLQKVELQLFDALQQAGRARFYWDFDQYYLKRHEAGQYIRRYLEHYPNELDNASTAVYGNFVKPKHISVIAAPTEDIQARYVSTWLRQRQRLNDGRRTAVVLCNENLLQTVVHCLPDEVDKVNVTTGYPLSQTPVASLIRLYYDLQLLGRTPRMQRIFQRHPYARYISDDRQPLLQILREVATKGRQAVSDPLFQESLFRAYTLVNRIENLRQSGDLTADQTTLQRLTMQAIQQTTIPFHGEPAEGIQVMGVLETRNLDFDHVLLLSCNEGNIPRGVNDSSFIPHSIRQAYELTTIDNRVAIYAYYFHRLLQRAGDVTMLYNNSTEDGQRGEMSRFMLQLMVESPHTIARHTLQAGQSIQRWQPDPIQKTPHVMQAMLSQFTTQHPILSPTAITKYMRCPLQFYYLYVADIQQPQVPDDEQELDNRIFGNIFHEAADIIYRQLPPHIDKPLLEHLLTSKQDIERAVDEAFRRIVPHAPKRGLHLVNREVIIHYLRQLITIDHRLAPFTILGLEYDVSRPLNSIRNATLSKRELSSQTSNFKLQTSNIKLQTSNFFAPPHSDLQVREIQTSNIKLQTSNFSIGGRIDRLDLIHDEYIRVVDYKTSNKLPRPLPDVEAIFQPEHLHDHSDYYLQTFLYADIIQRSLSERGSNIKLLRTATLRPSGQRNSNFKHQTSNFKLQTSNIKHQTSNIKVSPALLFIQHAGGEGYDPTLCFGREPIRDIAPYSARFNELLDEKISEIFSPDVPFVPTDDQRTCNACPFLQMCRH